MGQDIAADGFAAEDFQRFSARLADETAAFAQLAAQGGLSRAGPHIGLELEVWLIDRNHFPAPHNQSFLERLNDPEVVAELSQFSVEINAPVETLEGEGLKRMHAHLSEKVRCCAAASQPWIASAFDHPRRGLITSCLLAARASTSLLS